MTAPLAVASVHFFRFPGCICYPYSSSRVLAGPISKPSACNRSTTQQTMARKPKKEAPAEKGVFGNSRGKRVTEEEYEGIWEAWKSGIRTKKELMRMFHVNWSTITRILDRGYPQRGWQSIRERWVLLQEEQHQEQSKLLLAQQAALQNEWDEAKQQSLQILRAGQAAAARLVKALVEATADVKFTRTKKWKDKQGNWHEEEVPMSGNHLAIAALRVAQTLDILQNKIAFWHGGPEKADVTKGSLLARLMELPREQLDYMAAHGTLPPGMTDEDIFGPTVAKAIKGAGGSEVN